MAWCKARVFENMWKLGLEIKLPLQKNLLEQIQRIGEKNGSKKHILVDNRGVSLSVVVTGAKSS